MAFLGNIFKKKPGGTLFGNILRSVAPSIPFVGGALGQGASKIELGQTQTNNQLSQAAHQQAIAAGQIAPNTSQQGAMQQLASRTMGAVMPSVVGAAQTTAMNFFKKWWWAFAIPVSGLIVYMVAKPKGNRYGKRSYR